MNAAERVAEKVERGTFILTLKAANPDIVSDIVEAGGTAPGIPDLRLTWVDGEQSFDIPLEFKVANGRRLNVEPSQCAWHTKAWQTLKRASRGTGSVFVAWHESTKRYYIWPGVLVLALAKQGLNVPGAAIVRSTGADVETGRKLLQAIARCATIHRET